MERTLIVAMAFVLVACGGSLTTPTGSASHATYSVSFLPNPPGLDVSVCAGSQLNWSSQNVSTDANGNLDETWTVSTVRVTGQATATAFQATMVCVNGARIGSISATGSASSYSGTFSFGPSTGQVSVRKVP